jgi:Carboxypeptidase regulatory-like domain/Putative Ig domain
MLGFRRIVMNKNNMNIKSVINGFRVFSILVVVFMFAVSAFGQASLATLGTPVTENFDSLGTTTTTLVTDNTTITGVYAFRAAGNAIPNTFTADIGGSNTGRFNNYGSLAASDRTIGSLSSGTPGTLNYGVRYVNNTGSIITALQVTYTGEQWRNGGNVTPQVLSFNYRQATTVTDLTTGTYIPVVALNFTSLVNTAVAAAVDGNLPANRTTLMTTINVVIPVGEEIMLRWTDLNDAGNDHGFGVDDLSVIPTNPLDITTANSMPNGATAVAYTTSLVAAGGVGPYTFAVSSGAVPTGLTLNSNGTWSGLPTVAATYNFEVTATDSNPFGFAKGENFLVPNTRSELFSIIIAAPSAASASVRGRLISSYGRSLANAGVIITNTSTGETRYTRSNQIGYFNFQELAVGNIYVVEVQSKRFVFNSQSFTLNEDLTDLVLTAQ